MSWSTVVEHLVSQSASVLPPPTLRTHRSSFFTTQRARESKSLAVLETPTHTKPFNGCG
eukprot:m.192318 g.192318  ORF g.192318 m.192318 type:complete len:59 (+) comp32460_c0_seq2:132-308(+)